MVKQSFWIRHNNRTNNYETVNENYKDATLTEEKLMQIKTPTLYFSANDDDIAPVNGS